MNRDLLHQVTTKRAGQAAMAVIDALQHRPKPEQLAGLSMTFRMMCAAFNADPRHMLEIVDRMVLDQDKQLRPEARAVARYIREELG